MTPPDFNSAHRVRCLSLGGHVGVFAGNEDPRNMETSSYPVGSVYFRTDGSTWKRMATAWVKEGHQQGHQAPGDACPWLQVVRAVQAISTEAQVLRLIQTMSMGIQCHHEYHF